MESRLGAQLIHRSLPRLTKSFSTTRSHGAAAVGVRTYALWFEPQRLVLLRYAYIATKEQ